MKLPRNPLELDPEHQLNHGNPYKEERVPNSDDGSQRCGLRVGGGPKRRTYVLVAAGPAEQRQVTTQ